MNITHARMQYQRYRPINRSGMKENPSAAAEPDDFGGSAAPEPPARSVRAIGEQIQEVIQDSSLPPERKARAVYEHSRALIQELFIQPTAECIGATKKAVGNVADMILTDDDTAHSMLAVSQYDYYTYTHSVNVGVFAISLAKRLYYGTSQHDLRELGAGFFLHDIGKIRIDPAILHKPGKLSAREMALMRAHPLYSFAILNEARHATKECRLIALQHHERENGSGYPYGRKGDEIHDYARIGSIADVFDALVSKRPYKTAMPPFRALQIMREEMIGHFHRELLENFILLFDNRQARSFPALQKAA